MTGLLVLFVTAFVDMVGLTMIVPLLPYYATDFGASAANRRLLVSAFSIAQLLAAPVWGWFSDRYGRRPAILAGLLITAAAYVLFGFAGSVPALFLPAPSRASAAAPSAWCRPTSPTLPPRPRTKSLGWLSAITSLGAVAGPAFGSAYMSASAGQSEPGIAAALLSVLVAFFFAWRFLRESRRATARARAPAVTPRGDRAGTRRRRALTRWGEPAPRAHLDLYRFAIGAFYGTIQTAPLLLSRPLGVTERNGRLLRDVLGGMGVVVR